MSERRRLMMVDSDPGLVIFDSDKGGWQMPVTYASNYNLPYLDGNNYLCGKCDGWENGWNIYYTRDIIDFKKYKYIVCTWYNSNSVDALIQLGYKEFHYVSNYTMEYREYPIMVQKINGWFTFYAKIQYDGLDEDYNFRLGPKMSDMKVRYASLSNSIPANGFELISANE